MNDQIKEIEKMRRKFPSFMTPCVVEQGIIIYPKKPSKGARRK